MTSFSLNPNLVLNLLADIVLKHIITLIANFASWKILLHYFLDLLCSLRLCFLWSEWHFIVTSFKFYNLLLLLYVFHLTTISLSTIVFIPFLLEVFSGYINQIYRARSTNISVLFSSSFIWLDSLNTLLIETNSSFVLYDSI